MPLFPFMLNNLTSAVETPMQASVLEFVLLDFTPINKVHYNRLLHCTVLFLLASARATSPHPQMSPLQRRAVSRDRLRIPNSVLPLHVYSLVLDTGEGDMGFTSLPCYDALA